MNETVIETVYLMSDISDDESRKQLIGWLVVLCSTKMSSGPRKHLVLFSLSLSLDSLQMTD